MRRIFFFIKLSFGSSTTSIQFICSARFFLYHSAAIHFSQPFHSSFTTPRFNTPASTSPFPSLNLRLLLTIQTDRTMEDGDTSSRKRKLPNSRSPIQETIERLTSLTFTFTTAPPEFATQLISHLKPGPGLLGTPEEEAALVQASKKSSQSKKVASVNQVSYIGPPYQRLKANGFLLRRTRPITRKSVVPVRVAIIV